MLVDVQLQIEVEQFLYEEAAVLDGRRYRDWLDFFTEDTHYWMPIRRTLTVDQLDREFTAPGEMAYFNDDRAALDLRVRKLETGYSWSEDPPSRTRHSISNVRIVAQDGDELQVESNFMLYRTRLNSEEDLWVGMRQDVLRHENGSFKIAKRTILLDQTVLMSKNLTSFF